MAIKDFINEETAQALKVNTQEQKKPVTETLALAMDKFPSTYDTVEYPDDTYYKFYNHRDLLNFVISDFLTKVKQLVTEVFEYPDEYLNSAIMPFVKVLNLPRSWNYPVLMRKDSITYTYRNDVLNLNWTTKSSVPLDEATDAVMDHIHDQKIHVAIVAKLSYDILGEKERPTPKEDDRPLPYTKAKEPVKETKSKAKGKKGNVGNVEIQYTEDGIIITLRKGDKVQIQYLD